MIRAFDAFSLPLLRWLDPEDAHRLAIQGLRLLPPMRPRADDPKLAVRAFGLNFSNPVGMAAGLVGTLALYNVSLASGVGAVLAYRAIALSVPAVIGGIAFVALRRTLRDEAQEIAICAPQEEIEVIGLGRVQIHT